MSELVTGEAVALDLRLAGLPSRALAALLDLLVQLAAFLLLNFLLGRLQVELEPALRATLAVVITVAILVGYPVAAETLWRGRTPGKAALGLRVVRDDGGPIRFRQALARGLVGGIVEKPGVLVFTVVISVVTSLLSRRGKRLGDVLAGTVVLRDRMPVRPGPVTAMPRALAGWAETLDLSGVSDDLALAVRQFLARAGQLDPRAREELGGRLVAGVAAATRQPPPAGTPGSAYLSAVLAERRRREEERLRRQAASPAYAAPAPSPAYAAPAASPAYPAPAVVPGSAAPGSAAAPADSGPEPDRPTDGFAPPG